MPRRKARTSGAEYAWFAALCIVLFTLLSAGAFLFIKTLWFPVRNHGKGNSRIALVVLAIGMLLVGCGILAYQALSAPDGVAMSARLTPDAIGFMGFSLLLYFASLYLVFNLDAELTRVNLSSVSSATGLDSWSNVGSSLNEETSVVTGTMSAPPFSTDEGEIIHNIWCPSAEATVAGQRIAVVGYSHYVDEGDDHEDLTRSILGSVAKGERNIRFFTMIRNAFGFSDHHTFWSQVYFFNFLPQSVGDADAKYDDGSGRVISQARQRLREFLEQEQPDKVFVFSKKAWDQFPEETLEEKAGGSCTPLLPGQATPNWGTYRVGKKNIRVCGFKHPQVAKANELKLQVQTFLAL